MNQSTEILKKYFGYETFKPAQKEIIEFVLEQKNVLALLPTGGGKSLCFQIPTLVQPGICIVVSPLIALMQNQVNNLNAKGIKALMLESGIPFRELDVLLDNCVHGNYKFLYLSPERLQQEIVQIRIARMKVNLIAIDEAHCISKWGHDFRPSYRKISVLKKLTPNVPLIALTATATTRVSADILSLLDIENAEVVKSSFERKNISFQSIEVEDKKHALTSILQKRDGTAIIYVQSRIESVKLSNFLTENNFKSTFYHGGISSEDKKTRLSQWLNEEVRVMVATNAFGMGIDKANVRTVIHYHLPGNLESYFQEAGRAGRDDKPAAAILLHNKNDNERAKNYFLTALPTLEEVKQVYKKLQSFFKIAYGEGENTSHDFNFSAFCSRYSLNWNKTHSALQLMERVNILVLSKQYKKRTSLHFQISNKQLLFFLEMNEKYALLVKTILRTYPGVFDFSIPIDPYLLTTKTGIAESKLLLLLQELQQAEVLLFEMSQHDASITFLVPREDDRSINPFATYIKEQKLKKETEIYAVINYATDSTQCKNQLLLAYFGEKVAKECGICSFCLDKLSHQSRTDEKRKKEIELRIGLILENDILSSREIIKQLNFSKEEILSSLRYLLEIKKIELTKNNTYTLNKKSN